MLEIAGKQGHCLLPQIVAGGIFVCKLQREALRSLSTTLRH
jgi:hypothetical protein